MPIWAVILLTIVCTHVVIIVGWLAIGRFLSHRAFVNYMRRERLPRVSEQNAVGKTAWQVKILSEADDGEFAIKK